MPSLRLMTLAGSTYLLANTEFGELGCEVSLNNTLELVVKVTVAELVFVVWEKGGENCAV